MKAGRASTLFSSISYQKASIRLTVWSQGPRTIHGQLISGYNERIDLSAGQMPSHRIADVCLGLKAVFSGFRGQFGRENPTD